MGFHARPGFSGFWGTLAVIGSHVVAVMCSILDRLR